MFSLVATLMSYVTTSDSRNIDSKMRSFRYFHLCHSFHPKGHNKLK